MKLLLSIFCLYVHGFMMPQENLDQTLTAAEIKNVNEVISNRLQEGMIDRSLNDFLAVSAGFVDSEFPEAIDIRTGQTPLEIDVSTGYRNPLQYTVSDVEGVILAKGRFIGVEDIDFSRRSPGSYAVYIFAAKRVVRAFIVSKTPEIATVF